MIVDKKFCKRLEIFWWVYFGMYTFSILRSFLMYRGVFILNDYRDKGMDPSESKSLYVRLIAENGRGFAYIGLAVSIIYFALMLFLLKDINGMQVAAVIGFCTTGLSLIIDYFFWNKSANDPLVMVIQLAIFGGGLAVSVLLAVSMKKLVKPFSEKIAKAWGIYLCLLVVDAVIRLLDWSLSISIGSGSNGSSTSLLNISMEKAQSHLSTVRRIQSYYGFIMVLLPILCLLYTVMTFKKEMRNASEEQVLYEDIIS